MIRYFPFTSSFEMKMGTVPMRATDFVVETDEQYDHEIALKLKLLEEDHAYYYQSLPEAKTAQWDVLEKVLDDLVISRPELFSVQKKGDHWQVTNLPLQETTSLIIGEDFSLPIEPLDWIGRHVQEDLIILNKEGVVIAGQLCFPSGWSLGEKLGKQFMDVHAPLPPMAMPMLKAANTFMERIPVNKSFMRNNWGFRLGDQLDLSSKYSLDYRQRLADELPGLSHAEFGQRIFLRVEHQTLTRLPRSEFVLFTIHTYHHSLEEIVEDLEQARILHSFLSQTPAALTDYKVMTPLIDPLIRYLQYYVEL
jgi:dimethylamine monooxygenase subunit A